MNSYTKGKWAAEFDGDYWNVVLADAEGIDCGIVGCEGLYRCDGSDEANARLIAAAPDLLAELEMLSNIIEGCGLATMPEVECRIAFARAAIAKAIGESA